MLAANSMWGLMAPLAKFVMIGGAVSSLVMTDLRVFGAMVLFWIFSFFQKPEHVGHKDLMKLFGASLLAIVFNHGSYIFGVGLTSPVDASIITTTDYFGPIMTLCLSKRGELVRQDYISGNRVELYYKMPLGEIVFDFYDKLKSIS